MARARARAAGSEALAEPPRVESTHSHSARINIEITDGSAICFSDCHYDPDAPPTTAHRAVVQFAKSLSPDLLLCGGDALDWAALSRHPRIMWEGRAPQCSSSLMARCCRRN
jgi:predicted MPP superfamily phosphohydrolase